MVIKVKALKVRQWLPEWNNFDYSQKNFSKPEEGFFVFSLKASQLRALSGINRRSKDSVNRKEHTGIQRAHDRNRSKDIRDFVVNGYPYSELPDPLKAKHETDLLKKPGWLPTSIIANILTTSDVREDNLKVAPKDLVKISHLGDNLYEIELPLETGKQWAASGTFPIEIIDGQHRLFAFSNKAEADSPEANDFELPVVAFHGLALNWQAYLFWVINIKPKRISPSLAYDLYPMLRTQEWLEADPSIKIYKETRAQELVNSLWAVSESPWYMRINMTGAQSDQGKQLTQASWIRSLVSSVFKKGGLFEHIPWDAAHQAAFIILFGKSLREAVDDQNLAWVKKINERVSSKQPSLLPNNDNPQFYSSFSLLNTDQGIRAIFQILNDYVIMLNRNILTSWVSRNSNLSAADNGEAIKELLKNLSKSDLGKELERLAKLLAAFDWRTSGAVDQALEKEAYILRMGFRGGAGYKHLKMNVVDFISHITTDRDLKKMFTSILSREA